MLLREQPNGCVPWCMNAFVYMETKKEFFRCHWTMWKNVVLNDKTGKFYDKCHGNRAIRALEQVRKPPPQCVDLPEHIWQFLMTKIQSVEVTTHSPMLPWTIRHAAWVLTRYIVRKATRVTPYEKIREQQYWKEILPLGEQVLAHRPGAYVNQHLQPWGTSLWLRRDTLSDEHLTSTAVGVMRSRAKRRLQEPARWVPAAWNAMLFIPWSPHLNLPGRPRLQRRTRRSY